ncbi:hypothetical protein G7047_09960 [Diaphorobacter sp. HDW4A]|uniref:Ig-like domain-containing protein n=1 Tax=Diaphorobacter sp. HDW4A TaxID=2714924 RepID=UPI00140D2543|nr:Ig-like domain-containing protein [Diaphorobacter sp. HDW4A]QIL80190.1 hypothetical protein G7047_09960 [Diaphorobacter sp. HDW4A]
MNGGAGLVLNGPAYTLDSVKVSNSAVGIRVIGAGSPTITKSRLTQNGIGLLAEQNATPSISTSEITGNTQFGVKNLVPASVVMAQGNWWGHASGPKDSVSNPSGQGDVASQGVNYGSYLTGQPMLSCYIESASGYLTRSRNISIRVYCPQASLYRLQESNNFAGGESLSMSASPFLTPFTLSSSAGEKMVYVRFVSDQGVATILSLPQAITYAPSGPLVQFDAPQAGAVLNSDTLISVSATDPEGIRDVEILIGTQRLALLTAPPYQTTWSIAGVRNGSYTLQAKATSSQGLTATSSRIVQVAKAGGTGPAITASFAGAPLSDGATIVSAGTLVVAAESAVGVSRVSASVDGAVVFERAYSNISPATYSQFLDFAQLANGSHSFVVSATDADGLVSALTIPFTLNLSAPVVPQITSPANNASIANAQLLVSGTAAAGSSVQVYVDGSASGTPVSVTANGVFSTSVTLAGEGVHQLTATATNSRGTSPMSAVVNVTYASAPPTVSFAAPAPNAILTEAATITVVASAPVGISRVELYANDSLIASPVQAPYSATWDVSAAAEGTYVLKAVAFSTAGKSAQATRQVTVKRKVVEPEPPKTPYTGSVTGITPPVSYGAERIVITGAAVARETGQLIPNAALRIVLDISGFKRRINIATDETGQYRYEFVPAVNDNGTYVVSVVHPDETTAAEQGRFVINRLSFDPTIYNLTAPRDFASEVKVTARATAGTGATGVRWEAVAANQPSGSLPPGISVEPAAPINIPAGASVPMVIKFLGSSSAGEVGTVVFTAFANETGSIPRGTLTLNYKLVQAMPSLYTSPTYIQTGVQQENSVTEGVILGNRGLVAAQNVQVKLANKDGSATPSWIFLASAGNIGAVDVGAQIPLQVTASPDKSVANGIYNFNMLVTAGNQGTGTIPVSVAVTQSGQGGVTFHVTDIFTETPDANGNPIEGVKGARITLQNEAVLTYTRTLTTDVTGKATLTDLPPGTYTYRASGPRHADKSGRVFVRPGITVPENVHLKYQTVSIDFSVTETTIPDEYHVNLEATFQAQVPAPVVLLEPLSINLPDLQIGEEFTGELRLTNYGLLRADNVKFTAPKSDDFYKYEFLADIPTTLDAKQRIVIPYRITAIKLHPKSIGFTRVQTSEMTQVRQAVTKGLTTKAGSCSSYAAWATAECEWTCANGQPDGSATSSTFSRLVGGSCGSSGNNTPSTGWTAPGVHWSSPWGVGGWTGGGGSGTPIPGAPECTPFCRGKCCASGGSGPGGGGGGGSW